MYVGPVILVNQRTTRVKKCVAHLIKGFLFVTLGLRVLRDWITVPILGTI